ncbi:hypothetical protein O3P69_011747, partial [Scylla paramamosain]
PMSTVDAVDGTPAHLPCMAANSRPRDAPVLVVWYRDGSRRPFYMTNNTLPYPGVLEYKGSDSVPSGQRDEASSTAPRCNWQPAGVLGPTWCKVLALNTVKSRNLT